jgi:putative redox protein
MQVTVEWRGAELVTRRGSVRLELPASPTPGADEPLCAGELLLSALGACAAETLRSHPNVATMPIQGLRITVEADQLTHPGRYDNLRMRIEIDGDLTNRQRETILRVANACRVGNTLQRGAQISVDLGAGHSMDPTPTGAVATP